MNVSGRVIGEDLKGFPRVSIYDKDTTLLTTTGMDGTFELPNSPSKLIFTTVGAEWDNISITSSCSKLEVILLLASTYHYKSHRKIDRLRKAQFDNRAELHRRAYEQGVFENDAPCFGYEFTPNKPGLDEIRNWLNQKKGVIKEELEQLTEGDTIYIPYATTWRHDGTDRTALHHYSGYTDKTEFNCMIAGTLMTKDRRGNITFRVIDISECDYEAITRNDQPVNKGDV